MNKKFLSAILFGALMVSSTGTFVSCKDYDDDIDRIDKELTDIKSQIAALQTKVDAGKYVTGVTTTADGITITLNDGTSYPITNGKDGAPGAAGAAGANGTKVEISADGFFVIDGETTEWKAVAKDATTGETVKIKTPTVGADGTWVFYNEKGEAQTTTIKVAPVTAVQNTDKTWTLTVYAADGTHQEITVPTAASSLTDLMLITRQNGAKPGDIEASNAKLSIAEYAFTYSNGNATKPDRNKWAGQKALPADGFILSGTSSLKIQINPTKVDATDLELKLVDSKNNYLSDVELVTSPYTDLEYFSRAANANGLYTLSVGDKYFDTQAKKNAYWKTFEATVGTTAVDKAYAVTAGTDVRSKYEVTVGKGTPASLSYFTMVSGASGNALSFTNGTSADKTQLSYQATTIGSASNVNAKLDLNVWYTVNASVAAALYDMHLVYDNDAATLFGIERKEENGVVAIRVTKTPDNITKAGFELTIQSVDKKGAYNEAKVWLGETSIITDDLTYDPITHQLSENNTADKSKDKNFFQIDLTKMKNSLGTNGLALWNTKAAQMTVKYLDADGKALTENSEIDEFAVSELKTNYKDNTSKKVSSAYKSATNLVFEVTNSSAASIFKVNKQYTAVITFSDADGEELNTIKVPFTFTLPAITELFAIDPGFVKDGVANCYLYTDDFGAVKNAGAATFKLSRIFSKYSTNGFNVELNSKDKVGSTDKKSSELAGVSAKATATDAIPAGTTPVVASDLAYLTLAGTLGKETGYDQVLKLTISGKYDNAWTYPEDEVFNFQAKIMSPIEKGKIVPKAGNTVTIKASDLDGYHFGNDAITGYTYNSEVSYKVMPDLYNTSAPATAAWNRKDIKSVTGETGNKLYFEVNPTAPSAATGTAAKTVDGYLTLKGYQVDHTVDTSITIKVTDIWNRVKSEPVPVRITVGE